MNCPQCGSEMWDNTVNKKNPKGPDYKCKDKACAHPIWLDKKGAKGAPAKTGNGTHGAKWTWAQLSTTYRRALIVANKHIPTIIKGATPADIIAGAAVLFIAVDRGGVSEPAKELPATTQEPLDRRPAALDDDGDGLEKLPF